MVSPEFAPNPNAAFEPDDTTQAALRIQEQYRSDQVDLESVNDDFTTIVLRTSPLLYNVTSNYLDHNPETTDDVMQQVYLRAFNSLQKGKFRGDSQVNTWLFRITINCIKNELNHQNLRKLKELSVDDYANYEVADPQVCIESDILSNEHIDHIMQTVNSHFSDRVRKVFYFRHIEGKQIAEVAALAGLTIAATKQILSRAHKKMKDLENGDSSAS